MIYDTLDEALTDIDKIGTWDPDYLISHYELDYRLVSDLPDNVSGYSLPLTRTFFVNSKAYSIVFSKCHEIMHCLLDSTSEPLIDASMVSNSKIEARANHGAFYIMVRHYMNQTGLEPADFDVVRFGETCNLKPKFLFEAGNVAEEALNIKIPKHQFYK
ncbi:hypothetical protein [Lactiplantibacillus plajomi]|uniref:IrrE N-terminal-like domain-containing protein n=1 Tax=Lactiplantibacillus plajomi TaxID=1457217 RepID=A0ABV6K1I8_9LACO|nr:hypothetical protein [Lactiplantibacillus plajomi]